MISKLVEDNEVDLIFASDADYSFFNGPKCLQVTDFKLKNNGKLLSDVGVKSGFYDTLWSIVAVSGDLDVENIVKAEYPLIDGQEDPWYHLAIGLALGCDVLVGGISGLGPEKLDQIIKSAQDESGTPLSADNLLRALSKQAECDLSFQELKVHSDIPFLNILDKGYRCVLAAWRAGRQLTLQPDFANSDRRFNSREVL